MTLRIVRRPASGALALSGRLHPVLERVYAARGVCSQADLDHSLLRLLPVGTLEGIPASVELLLAHRMRRVLVVGDFDADGATSCALVVRALRACGFASVDFLVPNRFEFGYGLTPEIVTLAAARMPSLIVTVDNGISSHAGVAAARERGIDVLITDHHLPAAQLPDASVIVNPNLAGSRFGSRSLAGVGVAFYVMAAVRRALDSAGLTSSAAAGVAELLDLVALGTVADVVPLTGLNRAFVAKGLIALRRRERAGHVSLMDVARLSGPPETWHLGFLLGPRINAGGRIGRADLGARLLMEDDPIAAAKIAEELDRLNRERQAIEQQTLAQAEAEAIAALGVEEKGAVVVTAAEGWHPGVVGLVAARLKEKFSRPAFAVALEPGGIGTGSGRSIAGVDIGRAVRRAVAEGLLLKGGGHAMAAGITVRKAALAELRAFLETTLAPDVAVAQRASGLLLDGAVSASGTTLDLVATINRAAPFGAGNPEPVIALPAHTVVYAEEAGQAHMRVRLKSADGGYVNAISFRAASQKLGAALIASRGRHIHAAGSFAVDRWQGEERVQFRLTDIAPAEPFAGR